MSIIGNKNSSVSTVGKNLAGGTKLEGYPILSVPSTALQTSANTLVLQQIPNQKGLPISNLLFEVTSTDSNTTTSPVTSNVLENSIYEFQLKSSSGEILVDLKGEYLDFTNWQHLLNNNGVYTASPTSTIPASTNNQVTSWVFNLSKYISASDFPLTPSLTLNSQASRGTGVSSSSMQINVLADFTPTVSARSKIYSKSVPVSTTGVFDFSTYLPKGISVKQIAWNFGADSNLSTNSTFNFALGTDYLLQNASYLKLINKEQNRFPITNPHISGFFPLFIPKYVEGDTTKYNANVASVPSINGQSGITVGYWEQYI